MASSRAEPTAVTHRVAALLVLLPESGTATEKPACGRPQRHPDGAEGAAGGSAAGLPSGSAGGEEGLELGTARRRTPAGGRCASLSAPQRRDRGDGDPVSGSSGAEVGDQNAHMQVFWVVTRPLCDT